MHQEINRINDMDTTSSANRANLYEMDDNVLPIEPTSIAVTHIQDLNDYCLLEIFSSNSLALMDLSSLAETCKRFKQLIQCVFPKDFSIESRDYSERNREYHFIPKNGPIYYLELRDVDRILKNFGSHLSTLYARCDQDILHSVAKYCGEDTLEALKIDNMNSLEGLALKRLLKFSIVQCDFSDSTSLDIHCDSLLELDIHWSRGCVAILEKTFPNLQRFTFYHSEISQSANNNGDTLVMFIGRHKRLSRLNLAGSKVFFSSFLVHTIINRCTELEELSLGNLNMPKTLIDFSNIQNPTKLTKFILRDVSLRCRNLVALLPALKSIESVTLHFPQKVPNEIFYMLPQLQHLRELSLHFFTVRNESVQGFDVLAQLQNLREVHLAYTAFPSVRLFQILSQMRNLHGLHLTCSRPQDIQWTMLSQLRKLCLWDLREDVKATDVVNIIRQLKNLEELEIVQNRDNDSFIVMAEGEYSEIVKVVEQRGNVLTLKCKLKLSKNCDESRKVKIIKTKD